VAQPARILLGDDSRAMQVFGSIAQYNVGVLTLEAQMAIPLDQPVTFSFQMTNSLGQFKTSFDNSVPLLMVPCLQVVLIVPIRL
jgi:hypothetical protein